MYVILLMNNTHNLVATTSNQSSVLHRCIALNADYFSAII